MGKPGLKAFVARRKSAGNVLDNEQDVHSTVEHSPNLEAGSGGFRLMSTVEAEKRKEEKRKAQEKVAVSKFRPFGAFGQGNKARHHSVDDISPPASNRDSKSSNETQSSRPYNNSHISSISTPPSSADPSDGSYVDLPRPYLHHNNSTPAGFFHPTKKQLPAVPQDRFHTEGQPSVSEIGRMRALTTSSYASTAKAPVLDGEMDFGSTDLGDIYSSIGRNDSPGPAKDTAGRSLLAGRRRTLTTEPIKIDRNLVVEEPPASWESRGSAERLMSPQSPLSPDTDSPPLVPPHGQAFFPVAMESPQLDDNRHNDNAPQWGELPSVRDRKEFYEGATKQNEDAMLNPMPNPMPPVSTTNGTPAARKETVELVPTSTGQNRTKDMDSNASTTNDPRAQGAMIEAKIRAQRENEEPFEAKLKAAEHYTYTNEARVEEMAHQNDEERHELSQSGGHTPLMEYHDQTAIPKRVPVGLPSGVHLGDDYWENEEIPLGVLKASGCPSVIRNRAPSQPMDAPPAFVRKPSSFMPERPMTANATSYRASQNLPAFARHLPQDPHASMVAGDFMGHMDRQSVAYSRGPASVAGGPMGYMEPSLSAPSLIEQIHMREMEKPKFTGGASSKNSRGGPFTGSMSAQLNGSHRNMANTRMSQMPMMNGMPGMPMMNMAMGGPMGMNGMAYPMTQNDMQQQMMQMMQMQQFQQYQQFLQFQEMQQQQMQRPQSQQLQDPRVSMAFSVNQNNGLLGLPNGAINQRPMSVLSAANQQYPRPMSTSSHTNGGFQPTLPPMNSYAASIAPSERSNIGQASRYRPVSTHPDGASTTSGLTLQPSASALTGAKVVKGILKNKTAPKEEEEGGWGKMASRKKKTGTAKGTKTQDDTNELRELTHGLDQL